MAEPFRALAACASAFLVIVSHAPARADPPVATADLPGAVPAALPSIGRFEIVQGVGRNPPLMLDTSNGTTWSLVPTGQPNDFGWVRVDVMDASEAATARPSGHDPDAGHRLRRRRPSFGTDLPRAHG